VPLDATIPIVALIANSLILILIIASSKNCNKSGKHSDFSVLPIAVQGGPALCCPARCEFRCDLHQLRAFLEWGASAASAMRDFHDGSLGRWLGCRGCGTAIAPRKRVRLTRYQTGLGEPFVNQMLRGSHDRMLEPLQTTPGPQSSIP
jgi:hypothetical protein